MDDQWLRLFRVGDEQGRLRHHIRRILVLRDPWAIRSEITVRTTFANKIEIVVSTL